LSSMLPIMLLKHDYGSLLGEMEKQEK
jgi:hypothetical protein